MKFKNNRILWKLHRSYREVTANLRVFPDFLIMGTPFCAKTLLYRYLIQHPSILENFRNETSFFDLNYELGINWYKSNFPTLIKKNSIKKKFGNALVGETVNMASPLVAERISKIIPNPKIILIIRNPTYRAYAKYLAEKNVKNENESFENALNLENNRIKKSKISTTTEKFLMKHNRQWFLYRKLGIYSDFLSLWKNYFNLENMLIICSEDLFESPQKTLAKCCDFLNIDNFEIKRIGKNHEKNAEPMNSDTFEKLNIFFKPHNQKLFKMLRSDICWDGMENKD